MPLSANELEKRDLKRNLGAELLTAADEMIASVSSRCYTQNLMYYMQNGFKEAAGDASLRKSPSRQV